MFSLISVNEGGCTEWQVRKAWLRRRWHVYYNDYPAEASTLKLVFKKGKWRATFTSFKEAQNWCYAMQPVFTVPPLDAATLAKLQSLHDVAVLELVDVPDYEVREASFPRK